MSKSLFIDRDGVINKSVKLPNYLSRIEQFEFLPNTLASLRRLRDAGYELYVITNQAGVARGQATQEDIDAIHAYMENELEKEGIELRGIYVCPMLVSVVNQSRGYFFEQ
jgi:D-glycero-D-manno-heptose 1,7-bisphosphate phosphatase